MKIMTPAPLMLVWALALASCQGTGPVSEVEKAKTITSLVREAEEIVTEVRNGVSEAQREGRDIDSAKALKRMVKARNNYRKAMELDPASYTPRSRFAHALMLTGLLHLWDWEEMNDTLNAYRAQGKTPPTKFTKARDAARRNAEDYFRQAIRELDYYATYMMDKYPLREIHLLRSECHFYLYEFDEAAQALRDHVEFWGIRLDPKEVKGHQERIKSFENRAMEARERAELEDARG